MAVSLCLGTVADVFAECCFKYEVKKKKEKKAAILSPVPKTPSQTYPPPLSNLRGGVAGSNNPSTSSYSTQGAEDAEE